MSILYQYGWSIHTGTEIAPVARIDDVVHIDYGIIPVDIRTVHLRGSAATAADAFPSSDRTVPIAGGDSAGNDVRSHHAACASVSAGDSTEMVAGIQATYLQGSCYPTNTILSGDITLRIAGDDFRHTCSHYASDIFLTRYIG